MGTIVLTYKVRMTCDMTDTEYQLPVEMWEQIINNIHKVTELKKIALVSKLFYNLAHANLWAATVLKLKQIDDLSKITHYPIHHLKIISSNVCEDEHLLEISKVHSIRLLDIRDNPSVTDAGLVHLTALDHLTCLNIRRCHKVTAHGLTAISKLPLQELYARDCKFNGEHLIAISTITTLQKLDLYGNEDISEADLSHLVALKALWYLDIGRCSNISPENLRAIVQMNLHELHIRNSKITDSHLTVVSRMQSLKKLNVFRNPDITNLGLSELASLTKMVNMDMSYCMKITAIGLASLIFLPIEELRVTWCACDDSHLAVISNIKTLRKLDLFHNPNITDLSLACLSTLHNLQSLDLSNCRNVSPAGLADIVNLPLKELYFSYVKCTDAHLAVIGKMKRMVRLDVSDMGDNVEITDAGLCHLSGLEELQSLNIGSCVNITSEGLNSISHIPLEELQMKRAALTDDHLEVIGRIKTMVKIDISDNKNITTTGLNYLKSLPCLEKLDISRCRFTDELPAFTGLKIIP